MIFTKFEGCGNHFALFDLIDQHSFGDSIEQSIVRICDPHFGIGADGVLLVKKVVDTRVHGALAHVNYEMVIYNADGSLAQMCGNGLRCVIAYLCQQRNLLSNDQPSTSILTGAGPLKVFRTTNDGEHLFGVEMGWPMEKGVARFKSSEMKIYSFGNPHIVTYDQELCEQKLFIADTLQSLVPDGVNVSFAVQTQENEIELKVFERGCGWTLACGTGACASVYQGLVEGRFHEGQTVTVRLPGGTLRIEIQAEGLTMWGPAREIYRGELSRQFLTALEKAQAK